MRLLAADQPNRRAVIAVAAGRRGPAGPAGDATAQMLAGETLSGHRVVYSDGQVLRYASSIDLATVERVMGITTHAAAHGDLATVRRAGIMTEPTWAWLPGPVFLAANGLLTQLPPESGACLQVAVALDPNTLDVHVSTPIFFD